MNVIYVHLYRETYCMFCVCASCFNCECLCVWMVVDIRHLLLIIPAMLNENDEMYLGGDERTTIYNHSQPADLTTLCKNTTLYSEPLPSCFYCPSLQLLDRGDGKAFSRLRYCAHAGRCVWAMPSEKWMTGNDKGNGGWGERKGRGRWVDVGLLAVKRKCLA